MCRLDLYTINDIAKKIDLPESTVRDYRDRYQEFIPYTSEGRKRKYPQEAHRSNQNANGLRNKKTAEQVRAVRKRISESRFIMKKMNSNYQAQRSSNLEMR